MAIEGSILPYSFIEDEEERNKLLDLNRRFPPSMWFQGGDTAARTITPADASTVGNRITADQLMSMSSSGAAYRQAAEGRVNALRRLVGMSDVSLPASTLGTSLRSYTTGTDDEILQKIINLQSQAGLRSLDEHRTWYTNSGFDPHFFDKSRDAFRDYLTARQGEITHEISIGKEGERRVYEGNKKGRDEAFIEATSAIRARPLGPVSEPADIGATLNQMYSRLAVLGTKPGEVSSYGAAFEKIKVVEEKRRKGEIDDAVAEIASDIMLRVGKGEIKGAKALSEYDLRTQGYPSADRKAAREPLDSLIKQTEAELKEVDISAKRKLELAKLREDERLAGLEEGKLIRAYNIASTLTKQVKDGKVLWQDANEIFKDRLQITGKDRRITDVREINALSTYFMSQIESEKPESIQASALSKRAALWGDLASKKDGAIIASDLAQLNFEMRTKLREAFLAKIPGAEDIYGESLGVMLGRQLETVLNLIPLEDREAVWNHFSANLVNADERKGFNKATPSFSAPVDLDKADSVAAALQKLNIDPKQIISIMQALGFE